jgi:hypothetical protein
MFDHDLSRSTLTLYTVAGFQTHAQQQIQQQRMIPVTAAAGILSSLRETNENEIKTRKAEIETLMAGVETRNAEVETRRAQIEVIETHIHALRDYIATVNKQEGQNYVYDLSDCPPSLPHPPCNLLSLEQAPEVTDPDINQLEEMLQDLKDRNCDSNETEMSDEDSEEDEEYEEERRRIIDELIVIYGLIGKSRKELLKYQARRQPPELMDALYTEHIRLLELCAQKLIELAFDEGEEDGVLDKAIEEARARPASEYRRSP